MIYDEWMMDMMMQQLLLHMMEKYYCRWNHPSATHAHTQTCTRIFSYVDWSLVRPFIPARIREFTLYYLGENGGIASIGVLGPLFSCYLVYRYLANNINSQLGYLQYRSIGVIVFTIFSRGIYSIGVLGSLSHNHSCSYMYQLGYLGYWSMIGCVISLSPILQL